MLPRRERTGGMILNIAYFIHPKQDVATLYDDFTLRQGLEKMRHHGYAAIPVITRENKYVGTVTEGDFLWYLVEKQKGDLQRVPLKSTEDVLLREALTCDHNPPVKITAGMDELLHRITNQNFVPVVDDLQSFVGIVTRKDIIEYLSRSTRMQRGAQ